MSHTVPPVPVSSLLWRGARAGFSVPSFMVFVAMIGFGSLAKSLGVTLAATIISAVGIYGLPGQVAMLEAYATGASLMIILISVAMANMRFFPMSIVLMPLFEPQDRLHRWRYLVVQFMSVNTWSHMQHVASDMPRSERLGYFSGFAFTCFSFGVFGAIVGWLLAGNLAIEVTATLIFINPAYFIFLFCTNRNRNIIVSILLGAVMGPVFYKLSPEWGLPFCGLVAGTLGYLFYRKRPHE